MQDKTFAIIKPEVVAKGDLYKEVIKDIEAAGFTVTRLETMHLSLEVAKEFYREHKNKVFFKELIQYMTSGPVVALELKSDSAVSKFRGLIGSTDPMEAHEGTLRKKYATSKSENAIHGSDSDQAANRELSLIFPLAAK